MLKSSANFAFKMDDSAWGETFFHLLERCASFPGVVYQLIYFVTKEESEKKMKWNEVGFPVIFAESQLSPIAFPLSSFRSIWESKQNVNKVQRSNWELGRAWSCF